MFRDVEDYDRGFNCFALALFNTDSTGLVESEMSTHYHQLIQSRNPDDFTISDFHTLCISIENIIVPEGLERRITILWKLSDTII